MLSKWFQSRSLLGLAALFLLALGVALLVRTPPLSLPQPRVGEMLTQPIIVHEMIRLVDARSTRMRREQALQDFPPVYDHDTRVLDQIYEALKQAFQEMRLKIAEMEREISETQKMLRENAQAQLAQWTARDALSALEAELAAELHSIQRRIDRKAERSAWRTEQLPLALRRGNEKISQLRGERNLLQERLEALRREAQPLEDALQVAQTNVAQASFTLRSAFEEALNISFAPTHFQSLYVARFAPGIELVLGEWLRAAYTERFVEDRASVAGLKAIQVQTFPNLDLERFEALSRLADLSMVQSMLNTRAEQTNLPAELIPYRPALIALAQAILEPNLIENRSATEQRRQELLDSLTPVYFHLPRGQALARAGERASAEQVELLEALRQHAQQGSTLPHFFGAYLLIFGLLLAARTHLEQPIRGSATRLPQGVLLGLLLVGTLLFMRILLWLIPLLSTLYAFIPPASYHYLLPVALAPMLAVVLLNRHSAGWLAFVVAICVSLLMGGSVSFFLYAFFSGISVTLSRHRYDSRLGLWLLGVRVASMQIFVALVIQLLEMRAWEWPMLIPLGMAALNGLGVTLFVITLLPILERAFDITTDMRLLELANMNHPALRALSLRAPGTYHHSIMVGNLSEAAAVEVGLNSLFVRVASYYHDLGKMFCPQYFIENQVGDTNPHEMLPPAISARILIHHVTDGLVLARRYRLGQRIEEIIAQHHGNSLVRYFYHKARTEPRVPGLQPVPEEVDFRYRGPCPQTRAAGLVMLADITEATVRAMRDPTPETLRRTVHSLVEQVRQDGQLNDSGLTVGDLQRIQDSFTQMLSRMRHQRVEYPSALNVAPAQIGARA